MKRVVITGLGTVNPLGNNPQEFFDNLIAGKSGISKIKTWDASELGIHIAGEIGESFNPESILEKRQLKRYDSFIVYAVYAAKQAFLDAGLDKFDFDPYKFSSIMSTGAGGMKTYEEEVLKAGAKGSFKHLHPMTLIKGLPNMATGSVAIELNAKGSNLCIVTACASGTHSIGEAMHLIRRGDSNIVVAGAADASAFAFATGSFTAIKALSKSEDVATGSRPFDKDRNGFVISEGAGALILEDLEHAQARGAEIYAEIIGYGSTCDANHITAPTTEGPTRCMAQALESAKIKPEEINYINAHGTSTPINDVNESKAIESVFGDYAKSVKISSIKSSIGHALGAAGAIEAVMLVKSLQSGYVPGTINTKNTDPECNLDYMLNGSEKLDPKYVMSNSFGFGGHNGTIVLKKWEGK